MAESAQQGTANRVSQKLQTLYDSMDEYEQSVLEGILTKAGSAEEDVTGFSSHARHIPQANAFNQKILQTPVNLSFKNTQFEIPVLVLCW